MIVNRPPAAAAGRALDRRRRRARDSAPGCARGWRPPGSTCRPARCDGLVAETAEHAVRVQVEAAGAARSSPQPACRSWSCPQLIDGVDLGGVYELAELLAEQGVRMTAADRAEPAPDDPASLDLDALLADPRHPDRRLLRLGRGRQDHDRRRAGPARRRAGPQGRGADHRPGPAARPVARPRGAGQRAAERAGTLRHRRPGCGELHAMMLDMQPHLRRDGRRPTPRPNAPQAILANPFYQAISTSFSGTQEYMAMEKLGQLARHRPVGPDRRRHPAVPVGAGLPGRPAAAVVVPRRPDDPAALGAGPRRRPRPAQDRRRRRSALFAKAVSTILGGQMLRRRSAFVQALRHDVRRLPGARRTPPTSCCARPGTAFVVVAAPEPDALREASLLRRPAAAERMPLAGLVLNRTHPVHATLSGARAREGAETLRVGTRRRAGRGGAAAARRPRGARRAGAPRARPLHQRPPGGAGHRRARDGRRRARPRRPARDRPPPGVLPTWRCVPPAAGTGRRRGAGRRAAACAAGRGRVGRRARERRPAAPPRAGRPTRSRRAGA